MQLACSVSVQNRLLIQSSMVFELFFVREVALLGVEVKNKTINFAIDFSSSPQR